MNERIVQQRRGLRRRGSGPLGLFAALRVLELSASPDRYVHEPAAVARADTSLPIDSLESQVQLRHVEAQWSVL